MDDTDSDDGSYAAFNKYDQLRNAIGHAREKVVVAHKAVPGSVSLEAASRKAYQEKQQEEKDVRHALEGIEEDEQRKMERLEELKAQSQKQEKEAKQKREEYDLMKTKREEEIMLKL